MPGHGLAEAVIIEHIFVIRFVEPLTPELLRLGHVGVVIDVITFACGLLHGTRANYILVLKVSRRDFGLLQRRLMRKFGRSEFLLKLCAFVVSISLVPRVQPPVEIDRLS